MMNRGLNVFGAARLRGAFRFFEFHFSPRGLAGRGARDARSTTGLLRACHH